MPYTIDETHDASLTSWVESANDPSTDFPIQNLPLCLVALGSADEVLGVRIGDKVLNLGRLAVEEKLDEDLCDLCGVTSLAVYEMGSMTPEQRGRLRKSVSKILASGSDPLVEDDDEWKYLYELDEIEFMPWAIADYTDFYASVYHATNVGSMFRPDNPLLPNYKWIPVGYHGRASSVVPSGVPIVRPKGQQAPAEEGGAPGFGPCKMMDYELEMGVVIGAGNELGDSIPIGEAQDHILGLCLLNDWSARDMQKWEYQPLGPFLAKSFATTISTCVVTMEALAPFRVGAMERAEGDPQPLPHLTNADDQQHGGIDVTLEVFLSSAKMREEGMEPVKLSTGSFKDMYWTIAQMTTHHSSNGCNLNPGDLLGSGTISGPTRESRGCLLELTWDGDPFATPAKLVPGTQRTPITLPTGEERKFLADGDEVLIKGYCEREGFRRIGFGECRGIVEAARP